MNIGESTKKARKKAGLKRRELAEKSGYTYANIRNIENNLVNPKIDTVIDLAETLGISIYEYIGMKPKLEVAEVKHGKWEYCSETTTLNSHFYCSVCKDIRLERYTNMFKYCPHCGAKMDLEEGDEE